MYVCCWTWGGKGKFGYGEASGRVAVDVAVVEGGFWGWLDLDLC